MNTNSTNMKIDSETFVCMICLAAFIGYTLGLRNMVKNTCKTQQCHRVTQTNLSELADILTSSHLMIDNSQIFATLTMTTTTQTPQSIPVNDNGVCESLMVTNNATDAQDVDLTETEKEKGKESENHTTTKTITTPSDANTTLLNNTEEEYEVILGNVKKNDTMNSTKKPPLYYFGWFDSIF
jgi:hypothetical protein